MFIVWDYIGKKWDYVNSKNEVPKDCRKWDVWDLEDECQVRRLVGILNRYDAVASEVAEKAAEVKFSL